MGVRLYYAVCSSRQMRQGMNQTHSDTLYPWRYVTGALGSGRIVGQAKRAISRMLYEYLAWKYPQTEWTTMNYGYAPLPTEQLPVPIAAPERLALQLYWYVATSGSHGDKLSDLDILEIGSGRGGGAACIAYGLRLKTLVALDFSSSATQLARTRHQRDGVPEYVQGDAEQLLFDAERFDIVLNVESAHCYGSIPRFLDEVHRVLRPGGELLFADLVSQRNNARQRLEAALKGGPLRCIQIKDITPNVVRALQLDEERKQEMLDQWVTGPFRTFARGAYAMEGTAMRRELEAGQTVYLAAVLRKESNQ